MLSNPPLFAQGLRFLSLPNVVDLHFAYAVNIYLRSLRTSLLVIVSTTISLPSHFTKLTNLYPIGYIWSRERINISRRHRDRWRVILPRVLSIRRWETTFCYLKFESYVLLCEYSFLILSLLLSLAKQTCLCLCTTFLICTDSLAVHIKEN